MTDTLKIPENPHDMPPPYWDDCGSIDQLIRGLDSVTGMLSVFQEIIKEVDPLAEEWIDKRDSIGPSFDIENEQWAEIHKGYYDCVYSIGSYGDMAILMAAITTESLINKFCVYNLHKDIVEPLEKLNFCEKLIVAVAVIGKPNFRGNVVYDDLMKLKSWRNSFAHGHCVELRNKDFLKNHLRLTTPGVCDREVPQKVKTLKEMITRFIRIFEFLDKMTINRYVVEYDMEDIDTVRKLLDELKTYHFSDKEYPYDITRDKVKA